MSATPCCSSVLRMSALATVSSLSPSPSPSGSSSCSACRSSELAALFGLSDGLSAAIRSDVASKRLTSAGLYGTAAHKLHTAAAAVSPLLERAEERHRREVLDQQRRLLTLRAATATASAAAAPAAFPSAATVNTLRLLHSTYTTRHTQRIEQLRSGGTAMTHPASTTIAHSPAAQTAAATTTATNATPASTIA